MLKPKGMTNQCEPFVTNFVALRKGSSKHHGLAPHRREEISRYIYGVAAYGGLARFR
jgi:hypothetical protein